MANVFNNDEPHVYGEMWNSGLVINEHWLGIDLGTTLSNTGTLTNNFAMVNVGFLSNSGTLNNVNQFHNIGGLMTNEGGSSGGTGGTLDNHGYLYNIGELRNNGGSGSGSGGAVLNNHGSLKTVDRLVNGAGTAGGDAAVLNNFGTLTVTYYYPGRESSDDRRRSHCAGSPVIQALVLAGCCLRLSSRGHGLLLTSAPALGRTRPITVNPHGEPP